VRQALNVHRLHFAFTITFHYIFPQLTMGLALLLVYLKTKALRTGDEHYNRAMSTTTARRDFGGGSSGSTLLWA
jgi:cytochrome bd-type quinol oxidase subunit 1